MIIGSLKVEAGAVVTHRDTYDLEGIKVVSVRRPGLAPAILVGGGLAGFSLAFADLLYASEMLFLLGIGFGSILIGLWLAQLKLLSRDLRGSELVDAVWGSYTQLNVIRGNIAAHMRSADRGAVS
jgi:hypothetical protein